MPLFLIQYLLPLWTKFKKPIIVVLVVVGGIVGLYLWHISIVHAAVDDAITTRDKYWTNLITNAPPTITHDTVYTRKYYKDTTGIGNAVAAGIDSVRRAYDDSLMASKNRDSIFYALSAKQTFSHKITDDTSGVTTTYSMDYTGNWDPLHDPNSSGYTWGIKNVWIKQTDVNTTITKLIPLPFKRFGFDGSVNGQGQGDLGLVYRLGSEADPYDSWNSAVVGLNYQVVGPKTTTGWYVPFRFTVIEFVH